MASEKKVLKLAEKLAKRGKLEEAVAEYQKLLTGNAQDINVRNTICDLYVRLNQKDSAIKEFQTVARFYEEKGLYSQSIAIYKKINKLNPNDTNSVMKLAELYQSKGFRSEAKAEYLKIAKSLRESNRTKEAISLYEKILKLDQRDIQSRSDLAELYKKEKLYDKAVEELNKVAEFKIQSNELKEAEEILIQAKSLKEDHSRTLANLINVLKRGNKKKEALNLINNILKKDKENLMALSLLGNFHFEDKDFKKAEEIFSKIISLRAKDVETRVKLGRINIYQEKLDQAYELYEPLVDSLINRHREEKAIGLLGLILKSKKAHLPSLEKLAFIYKSRDQKKNFEVASRIILEEYRKKSIKEKMYAVLSELIDLCPEDKEFNKEYNILKEEFGPPEEERKEEVLEVKEVLEEERKPPEEEEREEEVLEVKEVLEAEEKEVLEEAEKPPEEEEREEEVLEVKEVLEAEEKEVLEEAEKPPEEEEREEIFEEEKEEPAEFLEGTKEILEAGLAQVDSFIEQGLMKSAKRILENLRLEYPDEAKIEEKIVALDQLASQVKEEEISVEEKTEKPPEEEKEKHAEFFKGVDEMLETNLAQVDLYIDQGLVKNARRILEDLRIKYPEELRIEQKIDSLRKISSQIKEEEIALRVGKVTERESKLFGKTDQQYPSFGEKEGEEKLTSAEIFAEADITPIVSQEREEEKYYDLAEKIDEELEVIKAIFSRQLKGDTTSVEKELSDIVSEFKESIKKGIDKKDYESRYNLGIAFLEQGLVDEAIEELKVAAQEKKRALECYSILSHCFRQKKDFQEAVVWIENALKQSKKGSSQSFELKYEMASLYEKLKETKKALNLYNEIKKWNAEFRDVAKKIEKLGKESSK